MPLQPHTPTGSVMPTIGMGILTMHGVETIVEINDASDWVVTDKGMTYGFEDVRAPTAPASHDPADVEKFLNGPELIRVHAFNAACTCGCGIAGNCGYLIAERGDERKLAHQKGRPQMCQCGPRYECCGYPLGM
jgi:hypothetical protein